MKLKIAFLLLILTKVFTYAYTQNVLHSDENKSDLIVKGSSTLHDWNMISDKFNCSIVYENNNDKLLLTNVNFLCNSSSLKSENTMMDKKAWDALDAAKFKTIQFVSNERIELRNSNKKVEGKIQGELNLKGIKKIITLPYKGVLDDQGNLNFSGEISIKMSEYGIEPPTALLGSIKTGDLITVSFQVVFDQLKLVTDNK